MPHGECSVCPPSVLSCMHYEGTIIWLDDASLGSHASEVGGRYAVADGYDVLPCRDFGRLDDGRPNRCHCDDPSLAVHHEGYYTDSLPEAEAEFSRRAEAILLGREPEPAAAPRIGGT